MEAIASVLPIPGTALLLFVLFFLLVFLGIPIAFGLALSSIVVILLDPRLMMWSVFQRAYGGLDSFILLAVPLFLLVGNLLNISKITDHLIDLAYHLVGHIKGGLGHVNVMVSMLFAGISGSSTADTAGIGSVLIPAMKKQGYSSVFSVAVTAASSVMGAIIPPSILMIVWAMLTDTSVAGLFLGGVIPGILIGVTQMALVLVFARLHNFPQKGQRSSFRELLTASRHGLVALGAPLLVVGGIVSGVFTPTEAGVAAVLYTLFLGVAVYRTLSFKGIIQACRETARLASLSLFCLATASIFGWLITHYRIPRLLLGALGTENPALVFLLAIFVTLIVGTFLDAIPEMVILAPIFMPLADACGIDRVHFGVVLVMANTAGLITPPYGLCLLLASKIGKVPVRKALGVTMLFLLVMIGIILLAAFVPHVTMFLPRLIVPRLI